MTAPRNALVFHCKYTQAGGEDTSALANIDALQQVGFFVQSIVMSNDSLIALGPISKARLAFNNSDLARQVYDKVKSDAIEIVHFHNTFPFASPSVISAAKSAGARTVQWLHNYRLFCPAATFYRAGNVCEDCLGQQIPWRAVLHRCYRHSYSESFIATTTIAFHRRYGAYKNSVDTFVALTNFAKQKAIEGGISESKLTVIPNHLYPDPGFINSAGKYGVFVGRLSEEKGIRTLLAAIRLSSGSIPIKFFGTGPLEPLVKAEAASSNAVEFHGHVDSLSLLQAVADARFIVVPSEWYEGLPRTIIEAFAVGTPVVASRLGAMSLAVTEGLNGLLFNPGNPEDLSIKLQQIETSERLWQTLRSGARSTYLSNYTRDSVIPKLLAL